MVSAVASPAHVAVQLSSVHALGAKQGAASLSSGSGIACAPRLTACAASTSTSGSGAGAAPEVAANVSRRNAALGGLAAVLLAAAAPRPAVAEELVEQYQRETQAVIDQVRGTLALERADPAKPDAVQSLKKVSNTWVAKYRREKQVAGRPSFSNMYSVLNALSGHYISFGPTYPLPAKRQKRILDEVQIAEKALGRGR